MSGKIGFVMFTRVPCATAMITLHFKIWLPSEVACLDVGNGKIEKSA